MKERLSTQERLIDDIDSVLDYIASLFDEGQYLTAVKLWAKIDFKELPKVTKPRNIEYYRILAKVQDEIIRKQGV